MCAFPCAAGWFVPPPYISYCIALALLAATPVLYFAELLGALVVDQEVRVPRLARRSSQAAPKVAVPAPIVEAVPAPPHPGPIGVGLDADPLGDRLIGRLRGEGALRCGGALSLKDGVSTMVVHHVDGSASQWKGP